MILNLWHCVWCGNHYSGKKHCTSCGTGIYSIEETDKQSDAN
ncbi:putative zinc ribbon protein [Klebsiella pneumoniae]